MMLLVGVSARERLSRCLMRHLAVMFGFISGI